MRALLLVITGLIAIGACSAADTRDGLETLVADGATKVRRDTLGSPAVVQLSYVVDRNYPTMAVSSAMVERLKQSGWQACNSDRGDWEHYEDRAGSVPRTVFQASQSFSKPNEFLVVQMQYFVTADTSTPASEPTNTKQYVIVLHYDLSDEAVRNQISGVATKCHTTPGAK